jgi:DeoR family transcriptional regulator, aga operon transcriptional repressor
VSRYRRWSDLLELLAAAGQLQVEDAAKALRVSAATIRRDFDELAGATAHHEGRRASTR